MLAARCMGQEAAPTNDKPIPAFGMRVRVAGGTADVSTIALPSDVVVLVHGLDEPGTCWTDVVPALNSDCHVVWEFVYPNDQAIVPSAALLRSGLAVLRG